MAIGPACGPVFTGTDRFLVDRVDEQRGGRARLTGHWVPPTGHHTVQPSFRSTALVLIRLEGTR